MLRAYISNVCLIWIKHKWMMKCIIHWDFHLNFLEEQWHWTFWCAFWLKISFDNVCSGICPIYIFLIVNCLNFLWLLIPHEMYGLSYSLLICGLSIYFFTCCLCCTEVLWHLLQTLFFLWKCSWRSISAATTLYHVHRQYIRLSSRLYGA